MNYPKTYREYVFSLKALFSNRPKGMELVLLGLCCAILAYSFVRAIPPVSEISFALGDLAIVLIGLVPAVLFLCFWPRSVITFDEKGFKLKKGLRHHSAMWGEVRQLKFMVSVRDFGRSYATRYLYIVTAGKKGPCIDISRLFDVASGELVNEAEFMKEITGLCTNLDPQYHSPYGVFK